MTVTFLILIALMLLLAYGGVAAPAIIFGAMIVAFWVMVFRLLIGFGRWVTTGQASCGGGWDGAQRSRQCATRRPSIGPSPKACRNSRCGRMNVASARFCSQCGSSLG